MTISDTDKIVAATLAAAIISASTSKKGVDLNLTVDTYREILRKLHEKKLTGPIENP